MARAASTVIRRIDYENGSSRFGDGFPPSLTVCGTDSLAEQIQRAFPFTKVVKTLNTVTARIMVHSLEVGEGD